MASASAAVPASQLDEQTYKRRVNAWALYDWANSAFVTTAMAAVLPVYYSQVAGATLPSEAAATALWSMGLSFSLFVVAIMSPILGTISDIMRGKKRFLAIFAGVGIVATGLMVLVSTGDWFLASILFVFGRIGMTGANVFYDALLPHVAREEDTDVVSTRGYALGYLGGGLLLAVNIVMIFVIPDFANFENAGTRLSLFSVAIWWAVFSIPLFVRIPEPPAATEELAPGQNVLSLSFGRLRDTLRDIQQYRELFKFLIAYLIYNDGIGTIIGVATIYGAELGFGTIELILALLLVQFVGIPFSLIFGRLPQRDAKWRPFFLVFVLINIFALPLVGIGGRFLLPDSVSGARPAPYLTTATALGEGSYLAATGDFTYEGDWSGELVPAEAQTGGGFFDFVNRFFGEELSDVIYQVGASADDAMIFTINGQEVDITYRSGLEDGTWAVFADGAPVMDGDDPVVIDASSDTVRYGVTTSVALDEPGEHEIRLVNTGGGALAVSRVVVQEPRRVNNLGLIMGLVLATEVLGLLLAWLIHKPVYAVLNRMLNLDETFDTKRSVILALCVYAVIAVWGFFLDSTVEFWFLAWMVAIVQGGSQALSRSLYAGMSPAAKSGEFFGLFGVMEKFSAILGPILFALAATLLGSSRPAILSLIAFFIIGIYLLLRVDVDAGVKAANEEDARLLGAAHGD